MVAILLPLIVFGVAAVVPCWVYFQSRKQPQDTQRQMHKTLLIIYTAGSVPLALIMLAWMYVAYIGCGDGGCPEWALTPLDQFFGALIGALIVGWCTWKLKLFVMSDVSLILPSLVLIPHFLFFAGSLLGFTFA